MDITSKRTLFRDLMNAEDILILPGVFDGYSVRLVKQAGFQAGFITGAGLSEAHLGWADVGIMSFRDNLYWSQALASCTDLPLFADCDTGYGNAVNVHFTVRAFEDAGVVGAMIEDQMWPKRCGHMKGKEVISAEEGAEKIWAAAHARRDPGFIIKARTDALATHGLAETIRRLNMYGEAGADLLFADAVASEDDIQTIARNISKPLAVNMGFGIRRRSTTPLISASRLQELGVSVAIYPRLLTAAAVQGMKNALAVFQESIRSSSIVERPDLLVSFEELNEIVGFEELNNLQQRVENRRAGQATAGSE